MPLDEFELFVQCFAEGKAVGFSPEVLHLAFNSQWELQAQDQGVKEWKLKYDESGRCRMTLFQAPSQANVVLLMGIQRPCGDARLWDALHTLLEMGNFGLYFTAPHFWAQKNVLIVAEKADASLFPSPPHGIKHVSSGADICRALEIA